MEHLPQLLIASLSPAVTLHASSKIRSDVGYSYLSPNKSILLSWSWQLKNCDLKPSTQLKLSQGAIIQYWSIENISFYLWITHCEPFSNIYQQHYGHQSHYCELLCTNDCSTMSFTAKMPIKHKTNGKQYQWMGWR